MGLTLYISNKGDMGVLVFTQVLLEMVEPFAIEEVCWMHWPGESLSIVVPPPLIIEKVGFECHHRWKGWGCSICNSVKAFGVYFWLEKKSHLPFSRQWTNYKLTELNIINLQKKKLMKRPLNELWNVAPPETNHPIFQEPLLFSHVFGETLGKNNRPISLSFCWNQKIWDREKDPTQLILY